MNIKNTTPDTEKAQKRVAVYCRVSTELEMQEGSFEVQIAYYRELITHAPGMTLVDVYGDKGKTGRNMNRPEFQRLLADCEAGRIDLIITKSISRFARNMADCIEVARHLKELGIPILFEKEGINTMDSAGEMLLAVIAAMAQEESNSISQNCLWASEMHNADGKPHFHPSYGYAKVRRDWEWHVVEDEAKRVRLAFALAAEGKKYPEIIAALNELERSYGSEVRWTQNRVRYLLTNVSYVGDCLTNKNVALGRGRGVRPNTGERAQYLIEGHHEPLVSREIFDLVQDKVRTGALHKRDMTRLHRLNENRRLAMAQ